MILWSFASAVAGMFRRPAAPQATGPDPDFSFLMNPESPPEDHRFVEAAYDAAQTVHDNRRYWRWADTLSAKAANSPSVRQTIRSRARYEYANNPTLKGMIRTLANDTIGRGPTLQLNSPSREFNKTVKLWWNRWAKAVKLWKKLRQARKSKAVDGESFLLLVYDPTVKHPVKWNVRVIEADRVSTPDMPWDDPRRTDGIVFDEYGNPAEYHILRTHPGDNGIHAGSWEYDRVKACYVLHWFDDDRPEQVRGISELSPCLGAVADLRRFTKSTAKRRDLQASITGFIETTAQNSPGSGSEPVDPFAEFDIEPGTVMALPPGNKPNLTTMTESNETFAGFKREMISDIGRPWGMSYNVAACNSSDSNFSSGKLDQRIYGRHVELDQEAASDEILNPLFTFWLFAAQNGLISIIPDDSTFDWEQTWSWPALDDPDPAKTSAADKTDIEMGVVSVRTVQMRRKIDPDLEERRIARQYDMTVKEYRAARRAQIFGAVQTPPAAPPPDTASAPATEVAS